MERSTLIRDLGLMISGALVIVVAMGCATYLAANGKVSEEFISGVFVGGAVSLASVAYGRVSGKSAP